MRVIILFTLLFSLTACEKHTDATSPCFGKSGEPTVSRSATDILSFSGTASTAKSDCLFEPLNGG